MDWQKRNLNLIKIKIIFLNKQIFFVLNEYLELFFMWNFFFYFMGFVIFSQFFVFIKLKNFISSVIDGYLDWGIYLMVFLVISYLKLKVKVKVVKVSSFYYYLRQ